MIEGMRLAGSIVAAGALAIIAGCAAAAPGRANPNQPTLAQTIDAQIASEEGIVWSPRRLLTWADFKAEPPSEAGVVAARTAYRIIDGAQCNRSKFEYRVLATFRPRASWVRLSILRTPADNARALRHEQTHFDLSEVHARRLRRYFAELMAPCKMAPSDFSEAASRMEHAEKAAQELYDSETDNGRNVAQQARWDKEVDAQLLSLAKFMR
jgi:hypothetical protein